MRAVRIHRTGGTDVLQIEEIPRPAVAPGQVLVRVEAAGVNFIDVYHRRGWYGMSLPFTPGQEAEGTVEETGEGVAFLQPGDRVAGAAFQGAYAEYALSPADRLVKIPESLAPRTAAALMVQGLTAHYLSRSTYPLHEGVACLVHAAAGGLGLLLCQMGRTLGARVIGTAGNEEKAERARKAGAEEVILYDRVDFAAEVRRLTGGRGVQVVYDSVGQSTFLKSLDCLAPRGTLVLCGQSSGPVEPLDPQVLARKGSLFLTRPVLAHYMASRDELEGRAHELFRWVGEGRLHVRVDRELPLAEVARAHSDLESRRTSGKVILLP